MLPINVRDLLYLRGVEAQRVEFKSAWQRNDRQPRGTAVQVMHSLCAFANDFHNVNGGYIIIGVAEANGVARLPPEGLPVDSLDRIQGEIHGICQRITPEYQPLMSVEEVDGKHILVLWAPGGDNRPYSAPKSLDKSNRTRNYYVRQGSQTVVATGATLTDLMQMTARVPFDDRRALDATLTDLRATLVREFLRDVKSALVNESEDAEVYRRMRLTVRINGHEVPRHIGLLCFSDDPDRHFPGARIEVVHFADDAGGNVITERTFRGPLHEQVRRCIGHLRDFASAHIRKGEDRADASGWVSYPVSALDEAVVNAVYHRSYEPGSTEPTKVYLYPDRIEVTSYPGPVPGLDTAHLQPGAHAPQVPARNRRIGEFFKELRLAEQRGTGIPKIYRAMADNGSPPPRFDFDRERSYFRATLPAHPEYVALQALRDAAELEAVGDLDAAWRRIDTAYRDSPGSGILAARLIAHHAERGSLDTTRAVYRRFLDADARSSEARVTRTFAGALIEAEQFPEARDVLDQLPAILSHRDAIELAIQERRADREDKAHKLFQRAGEVVLADVRALLEFAQCKSKLARRMKPASEVERQVRARLQQEAYDMLRRVIQMDAGPIRHAWAWYELGYVMKRQQKPRSEVLEAFERAAALAPDVDKFRQALTQAQQNKPARRPRKRRKGKPSSGRKS